MCTALKKITRKIFIRIKILLFKEMLNMKLTFLFIASLVQMYIYWFTCLFAFPSQIFVLVYLFVCCFSPFNLRLFKESLRHVL